MYGRQRIYELHSWSRKAMAKLALFSPGAASSQTRAQVRFEPGKTVPGVSGVCGAFGCGGGPQGWRCWQPSPPHCGA